MPDKVPMTTVELPGYTSVRRDRKDGRGGGGIIAYIRNSIPFHHWKELDGPQSRDLETIWLTIRPRTLPRGVSNILLGLLYHPPDAKDGPMLNHIAKCLDHILAKHPDSGIIICGDTNRLKDHRLRTGYQLKQLVKEPTRGRAILDRVYTNMYSYYDQTVVLPPIGLSDHKVVVCSPALSCNYSPPEMITVQKRCMGGNERAMFAHAIVNTHWEPLYYLPTCQEQFDLLQSTITKLLDTHMPIKTVNRHSNDRPWITDDFRSLLLKRDQANKTNSPLYKFYRNRVNTARKRLRKNYYTSKAQQVCSGGAQWWRHVRDLAGMRSKTTGGLQGLANNVSQGDMGALAQMTNSFFQSVCAGLQPITMESDFTEGDEYHLESEYIITVESVERRLMKLDPRKAAGPDGIPTWVLRDFAGYLPHPPSGKHL